VVRVSIGGDKVFKKGLSAFCLAMFLTTGAGAEPHNTTLVSVRTPRGAKQAFILIRPEKPVAAVILFAGGHGALGLRSASKMAWGAGNFLVRSRNLFADQGLMVAVVDAPSDRQAGMNAIFRMSRSHADDIGTITAYLKKQAAVPVWLVGTSMGTFSAAGGAIAARDTDGLVLTSTITRAKTEWRIAKSHRNGVASMALPRVTLPTLIVSHRKDGCDITPAADASKLEARLTKSPKVEVALLDGGSKPQSEPCQAKSQHGFLGIEALAVATIARFIKTNASAKPQ
jgi:pimeloyl-ACP methyl ester carboxylesterase